MSDRWVCLDLFCGLGGFSAAFEDSDEWDVVTVDIGERFDPDVCADVLDLRPSDLLDAIGEFDRLVVLASPPCTCFSLAANGHHEHFDGDEPLTDDAREAVALVYHTLGLIRSVAPDWWVLENPRGKLRRVIGPPTATVTLCQYGYTWQKPTDLWGDHPPMHYRTCSAGDECHQPAPHGFDSGEENHERDPAERAKMPYELSDAILEAVEGAFRGEPVAAEQATLPGAPEHPNP